MRVLVISDIHANLTALETVLSDAGTVDAAWCLGDLVGYGPDPNECVSLVRSLPNLICVLGNHDAAVLNMIDTESFNAEARQTIQWTQEVLSESSLSFLDKLPERAEAEQVVLVHGSPRHPVWEYILDLHSATQNFDYFQSPFCFVGHTHLPVIFYQNGERTPSRLYIPEPNTSLELNSRAIINPGSVGQPRDRDPRAAYVLFDTETSAIEHRRVKYDIEAVQERMTEARLPFRHIRRLTSGW